MVDLSGEHLLAEKVKKLEACKETRRSRGIYTILWYRVCGIYRALSRDTKMERFLIPYVEHVEHREALSLLA